MFSLLVWNKYFLEYACHHFTEIFVLVVGSVYHEVYGFHDLLGVIACLFAAERDHPVASYLANDVVFDLIFVVDRRNL